MTSNLKKAKFMNKILVIGLGGTIGSVDNDGIGLDENCLKILNYTEHKNVLFEGVSPFKVLSENMIKELWQKLIDFLDGIDFSQYKGVIILHGSDTLAFTSSIIANAFWDKNIVLVASDRPTENPLSNAKANFDEAVAHIIKSDGGVYVSYDGIKQANCITSADINDRFRVITHAPKPTGKKKISSKNVLIIKSYVGMNFSAYNLENIDEVLIEMYHSATVPESAKEFVKSLDIPYHFVTHKMSAEYKTAKDLEHIIFGTTIENAYAMTILE